MPLFRVPTGGVGPSGPISDVFSGTEHISNPNDPRLAGIDINSLPVGQAPSGFQSAFPSVIPAGDISKSTDQGITSADNNALVTKAQNQSQAVLDKLNGFLTANESLAKNISELTAPSPEETKNLADIKALDLANKTDITNFRNTPDNTFFTFGRQSQAVLDTTALTRQSLVNTLQSETASRQAKLDAAKFLYDANRSSISDTLNLYKSTVPENISTQVDPLTGNVFVITRNPLTGAIGKQDTGVFIGNKDDKITVNNLIQKYPDAGILPTDSLTIASGKVKNSAIFAKETQLNPFGTTGTYVPGQNPTIDNWAKLIIAGQAKITDVPNPRGSTTRSQVIDAITNSGQTLLDDKDREKLSVLQNAKNVVATLKELSVGIAPRNAFTRIFGGPLNYLAATFQTNDAKAAYMAARSGFVSNIARTLGEKGTLAEGDVARAIANIPTLADTQAVAKIKFGVLQGILDKAGEAIIGASTKPLRELPTTGTGALDNTKNTKGGKNYLGI